MAQAAVSPVQDMGVSFKVALATAIVCLKAGIVPYVKGPPGCAKTAMARLVQEALKYEALRVCKPSFHESVDFTGVPFIHPEDGGTYFAPNYSIFPGPKDPATGLLLIDEAADASVPVKNVLCSVTEERRAASYVLPEGWHVMLTGNRVADKSGATKEITKLISRVCIIHLYYVLRDFMAWAPFNGIHGWITGYLGFAPQHLMTFDPNVPEQPYACARTWEKTSNILKVDDNLDSPAVLTAIDGLLGGGVSRGFRTYVQLISDMPDPLKVIADPHGYKVPDRPEVRWALCSAFIHHATKGNVKHIRAAVERMQERELQMFLLRSLVDSQASKVIGEDFGKWVADCKDLL
jgi:hypothetical protein